MSVLCPRSSAEYERYRPSYIALGQEIEFIIRQAISEAEIKIHDVECRVKQYHSLERKLGKISGKSDDEINDIVGARIICLFMSDLKEIDDLLRREFEIYEKDDKIQSANDAFGYMSVHYICGLKKGVAGRRYDAIKAHKFEVQVRTLCMHAWAAISHYLDYKAEWDIPDHLKKGLNALSGLFFVADSQYEQLYKAREQSREKAKSDVASSAGKRTPINLDTMMAALTERYPDREADSSQISELISELLEAGFNSVEEVLEAVEAGSEATNKFEKEHLAKPENEDRSVFYTAAGLLRISLKESNENYKRVYEGRVRHWREKVAAKVEELRTK